MADPQSTDLICHYGWLRKERQDGQFYYDGGSVNIVCVNEATTYEDFVILVSNRMHIDPSGKFFRYTSRWDNTLIDLTDTIGLQCMMRVNDKFAHVYISDLDKMAPNIGQISTRESNIFPNDHCALDPLPTPMDMETTVKNVGQTVEIATQNCDVVYGNTTSQPLTCNSVDVTMPFSGMVITIAEDQLFDSPDIFKQAVACLANCEKFEVKYLDNSRSYYRIRCKCAGCGWKLTAGCEGNTSIVRVKSFLNVHTHTAQDIASYKPCFRSKYVGQMIKGKILNSPQYLPREISKDFEASFAVQMSYKQAWRAKEYAKASIVGAPRDSYKYLPWMCQRLRDSIPGTHASLSLSEEGRFNQMFIAYGISIAGFRKGCRPLLFIDSCHLTAYYGGVLMCATALEGNNGLYPLAYCFASAENDENWLWFMQELKAIVCGIDVVLVTDRNPSLLNAIIHTFGGHCNAWCLRHLKENFSSFARSKGVKSDRKDVALQILNDIAYARDEHMFRHHLDSMYKLKPELGEWVEENNPRHWANALFPKKRWDCLSTNPAESLNAWLVPLRDLTIYQFMKDHVSKLTSFLLRKKEEIDRSEKPVGHRIEDKIRESQWRSRGFTYRACSDGRYTVYDSRFRGHGIDLLARTCACLGWQQTGIPCPHAMTVIGPAGLNVYDLLDWYFKREAQERVYEYLMPPVSTHDEPNFEDICGESSASHSECGGPPLGILPLPLVTKRHPGRPRKKRIESQFQDKRITRCSRCHSTGHNRKTCIAPLTE